MSPPARSSLPKREEKTAAVRAMFDAIAPRYDLVNRLMTFGLDQVWRANTVDALALRPGSMLCDLACGTGDLTMIARRRGHRVVGADLSFGMLAARRAGVPALQADASRMPFADATFDGIVSGYALRNFTDLDATFDEMARVVRPGGRLAVLEVAQPSKRVLRAGFDLWFRHAVPAIGALLSDPDAYRYLPESTVYLPGLDQLRTKLTNAGFSGVNQRLIAGGLSQIITATRTGRLERSAGY